MTEQDPANQAPRRGFPPSLFLIGAQKCATTFLAECLAVHPEIELASPKEPDFFSRNHGKGLDWYSACFRERSAKYLLDASPSYSVLPWPDPCTPSDSPRAGVHQRIHEAAPDARVLYVVRDPVKRAYASYWHAVRRGDEQRPFLEALSRSSWYLDGSRYYHQLSSYMKLFPKSHISVLQMDRLVGNPEHVVNEVLSDLQIPGGIALGENVSSRNRSLQLPPGLARVVQSPFGYQLLKTGTRVGRAVLPSGAYDSLRGALGRSIPSISAEEYARVYAWLQDDIEQFQRLTGLGVVDTPTDQSAVTGSAGLA